METHLCGILTSASTIEPEARKEPAFRICQYLVECKELRVAASAAQIALPQWLSWANGLAGLHNPPTSPPHRHTRPDQHVARVLHDPSASCASSHCFPELRRSAQACFTSIQGLVSCGMSLSLPPLVEQQPSEHYVVTASFLQQVTTLH